MGFSQRLELRQSQALVMTPQLQQAIKMLQLSNLELTDFVDAEIQQNPLLERRERGAEEAPAGAPNGAEAVISTALPETLPVILHPMPPSSGTPPLEPRVTARSISAASPSRGAAAERPASRTVPGFEQTAARPRTLREHVIEQIGTDLDRPRRSADRPAPARPSRRDGLSRRCARWRGDCSSVALKPASTRSSPGSSNSIPPGSSPAISPECLALQLRDRNRLDPAMQTLLDNLPLLAARNIAALMRVCRVDAEDVAEMIAEIKSLDPRPGLAFDPPLAQPVVPDILMRAQPRRWLDCRAQRRNPAARVGQQQLPCAGEPGDAQQGGKGLSDRPVAGRKLAGQIAASASYHNPQGRRGDRTPAGCVFSAVGSSPCGH